MSLTAFLESGGEAVVRGILSRFSAGDLAAAASGGSSAHGAIGSALDRKGYSRFELSSGEIREVMVGAAQSLIAAAAYQRGTPIGTDRVPIPQFPGSGSGDDITITFIVKRRFGGELVSTVADTIISGPIPPMANVIQDVLTRLEVLIRPNSPPPIGPQDDGRIERVIPVSVYKGPVVHS